MTPQQTTSKPGAIVPAVSIVMATFNRSNIIGYAIQSVLNGTFRDWELIVVGDHCTDDTADVVQGFDDPRIRFVNLERNFGEQSGPNNAGVGLARGKYLAFLNHDDLWLPDHLRHGIAVLEEEHADLVFGQGLVILNTPPHALNGAVCDQRQPYSPGFDAPASLWIMRGELAKSTGPWKPSWTLNVIPSQEWLYRAHRNGARIVAYPLLSMIKIPSDLKDNVYRNRASEEHAAWFGRSQDEAYLRSVLSEIGGKHAWENVFGGPAPISSFAKLLGRRLLLSLGILHPFPRYWFKYWRKGSFLRHLRQRRGLPDIKSNHEP